MPRRAPTLCGVELGEPEATALAPSSDDVVRCDCGWAPELGAHYRVGREEAPPA